MTKNELNAIMNPDAHKEGLKNLIQQCLRPEDFRPVTIAELKARHEMLTALADEKVEEFARDLVKDGGAWMGEDKNGKIYYALFPVIL